MRHGTARSGMLGLGLASFGRHGSSRCVAVCRFSFRPGAASNGMAGVARSGGKRHGMARFGKAGEVRQCTDRLGRVRQARLGGARFSLAWRGLAR